MNSLIEINYVLHILWGYGKCLVYKYNLKYLTLPIIYLLIILLVASNANTIVNEITYKKLDSYTTVITTEDKIKSILERYNLTKEQFDILCAIVLSEAQNDSYEDAYAVINTIYNRTHSKNWVKSVNKYYGNNLGTNLYYQAIAPHQFTVYEQGKYKKNLNKIDNNGYDAIIDFLYTEEIMHNYLSFRSNSIKVKNSENFSSRGNNYFNLLLDSNRI